jgi:DegV family protein with EDD domain
VTVHLVTDSTADFLRADAARLNVSVVPLTVRFGDEQFRDGVDIDSDTFYRRLARGGIQPTTSQPSPNEFAEVYRTLLENPDDSVVSIHISGKLSGTLQSANLAAQDIDRERLHLVDSESVSGGLQLLVRAARDDVAAGLDAASVAAAAVRRRTKIGIYVLLDTLMYLQRGGRIGRAQAMLGSLLSVKPVLTVEHGEVAPVARVRSRKQGLDAVIERLRQRLPLRGLAAFHIGAPELLPELRAMLAPLVTDVEIVEGEVGPVVGVYAGPGGAGIACLSDD